MLQGDVICFFLQLRTTFINSLCKPWTQMPSWNSDSPHQHPPLHLLLLLLHRLLLGREEALTAALWTAAAASESKSAPPTDFPSAEHLWKPCVPHGASLFSQTHFLFPWKLLFCRYYSASYCVVYIFLRFLTTRQIGKMCSYVNCWAVVNIFMNASLNWCFFNQTA